MSFPPPNWPHWLPHSPPHSTEIEHRLTELEVASRDVDRHEKRLNLHEKALLIIGGLLQILMQDKYPAIAKLLKEVLP